MTEQETESTSENDAPGRMRAVVKSGPDEPWYMSGNRCPICDAKYHVGASGFVRPGEETELEVANDTIEHMCVAGQKDDDEPHMLATLYIHTAKTLSADDDSAITDGGFNLNPFPPDSGPKCPECGENLVNQVGGGARTLAAVSTGYDDSGEYHRHDPNRSTSTYECENGHRVQRSTQSSCPAPSCDYGGEEELTVIGEPTDQSNGDPEP